MCCLFLENSIRYCRYSLARPDPGNRYTVLTRLAQGEPDTYCTTAWIDTLCDLDEAGVSFMPWLAQPFLTQFPDEFLCMGQGHHCHGHPTMVQYLEEAFRGKRNADLEQ